MPSLDSKKYDPVFKIGLMIVCLTLVMFAGFLLLYFKSELDVQQISSEIGIIRSQLEDRVIRKPGYHQGMTTEQYEAQQAAAATGGVELETLPHRAGEPVYASCHNDANDIVYVSFKMGVDTGSYGYYDSSGGQMGTYMYRVPNFSKGSKLDLKDCTALTAQQFSQYVTNTE